MLQRYLPNKEDEIVAELDAPREERHVVGSIVGLHGTSVG